MRIKICPRCKKEKLINDFHNNKSKKDKLSTWCKNCNKEVQKKYRKNNPDYHKNYNKNYYQNNREKERKRSKKYYKSNQNKERKRYRKYKYNLTPEQYNLMLRKQDNKCAICKEDFIKTPHVDHCHETNKVRGLLCNNCNRGLGGFKDNDIILVKAIKYLNKGVLKC